MALALSLPPANRREPCALSSPQPSIPWTQPSIYWQRGRMIIFSLSPRSQSVQNELYRGDYLPGRCIVQLNLHFDMVLYVLGLSSKAPNQLEFSSPTLLLFTNMLLEWRHVMYISICTPGNHGPSVLSGTLDQTKYLLYAPCAI